MSANKHAFSGVRPTRAPPLLETAESLQGLAIRFDPNLLAKGRKAILHRADCKHVNGVSYFARFASVTPDALAKLAARGYRITRHACCRRAGPGNYIPDAQRHTEKITLRLPPEVASAMRAMASDRECTLAALVQFMIEACERAY